MTPTDLPTTLRAATPTLPPHKLVALCIQAAREIERLRDAMSRPYPDECPCENEQPDPCPACGASVASGACMARRYRKAS